MLCLVGLQFWHENCNTRGMGSVVIVVWFRLIFCSSIDDIYTKLGDC